MANLLIEEGLATRSMSKSSETAAEDQSAIGDVYSTYRSAHGEQNISGLRSPAFSSAVNSMIRKPKTIVGDALMKW